MRVALYVAAVFAVTTATPGGYYHQEYNYKTSASSYKNNELQHKTDDQGYYSKDGDLEGRIKPKVRANSEHSEYVNPRLREQGNVDYYGNGLDVMSHGNMLANSYGASAGGVSSGYGVGSQYTEGVASNDYVGGAGFSSSYGSESSYASSSLQSIASRLQNDLQREMQSALISQAHQADISQLEAELHRNLTARLNELLQERFGAQTIRSGQSYSLHEGRVQGRPNYEQREIEQLQHQVERGLLDKLRQDYNYRTSHSTHYSRQDSERYVSTTTYRPVVTYRPIYPNLNVIDTQGKHSTYDSHQREFGTYRDTTNIEYHQRPNVVSVTTIASNVQRDLNNQLNRILEDIQRQYFSENARYTEFNSASLLNRLKQDLKSNLTYALEEELRRNFGTQIQKDGYMFTVGSGGSATNQYNYNILDLDNLRRQVEENLITKLNRDFESARQHWISRQQHVQSQQTYHAHDQIQSSDYAYGSNNLRYEQSTPRYPYPDDYNRPTSASIVPLIGSGVKSHYQVSSTGHLGQVERQLQADLTNQLQAALTQNRAYIGRHSSASAHESFDEAYRRLYEELQRNLTQQLHSFERGGSAYSSSYGSFNENQLEQLRSQLQRNLATQLQQGLQQSYSASASYSASSSSSSSNAGAGVYSSGSSGGYYRPTRGSSDYIVAQYMGGASYSEPDCLGDDPSAHQYHRSKRSYGYRNRPLGLSTHAGAGFSSRGTYGGYGGGYSPYEQESIDPAITLPVASPSPVRHIGQEIDDTDETQQVEEIDPGFGVGQVELGQEEDDSDNTQQVEVDHQFGSIGLGSQSLQTGYGRSTTQKPIYYTRPSTVSVRPLNQESNGGVQANFEPDKFSHHQRGDIQQATSSGNQIGQEEDDSDDVQRVEGNDFANIDLPSSQRPLSVGIGYQPTSRPYRPSGYGTNYQPKYSGSVYGGRTHQSGNFVGQEEDSDDTQQIEIDHGFSADVTGGLRPVSQQAESGSPQSNTPKYPVQGFGGRPNQGYGPTRGYNPSTPSQSITKRPLILNYGTQNVLPQPETVEPLPNNFQGSVSTSPRPQNIDIQPQTNNLHVPVQSGPVTIGNINVQPGAPISDAPINIPIELQGVSEKILLDLTLQVEDTIRSKLSISATPDQLYKETLYNLRVSITRECQKILSDSKYFYLNIHQKDINILEKYVEAQMIQRVNQLFISSPYVRPGSINYEPVPQHKFIFVNAGTNPNVPGRPRPQVSSDTFLANEINSHGAQYPTSSNPNNQFRPVQFDEIPKPVESDSLLNVRPQPLPFDQSSGFLPTVSASDNDRQKLAEAEKQADVLIQTLRTYLLEKKGRDTPHGIVQVKLENLTPEQLEIIEELVEDFSKVIDHEVENIVVPNNLKGSAKEDFYRTTYVNIEITLQNFLKGVFEGKLEGRYPVEPNLKKYESVLDEKFSRKEFSSLYAYIQIKVEKKLKESLNKKLNIEAPDYTDEVVKFHNPVPEETRVFHLENATPAQKNVVNGIEYDFSRLIDLEIQNIRIPVYLDDKTKLKHFDNTLHILEQNLIKNISDSLKGKTSPSGEPVDLSKYSKLVGQTFELQTVPLLQEYLENKLITTLKTKLRTYYNIGTLEDTQDSRKVLDPVPDQTHVKAKVLSEPQGEVLKAITNDFSHLIDIAIQNIEVPTDLDDDSKLEEFQASIKKLEQELKRNITDLLQGKIDPYSGPVDFSKYSGIIKQNFDLESLSILQEYLEISLSKKLRTKLSRVYHIEITEETYEVPRVVKPTRKQIRVVKLENITPEQLTIINEIENDFSVLIDLAIEKIYIPENIGDASKFEDYKMFFNLLEQQLVKNLSDTIQGKVVPSSGPVNLAKYSILVNNKFDHQKIPTLQDYLEIKLTKKLKSKLSTAYNIETEEDTREVRRIVKPNPRDMRVVKLENVTPEQMTLINQIESDFSNLIELAIENVYVPDDLNDITKFDQYMITMNKLEQQVKRNLSDCIEGRIDPYSVPTELLKYSNLVRQKFESQKISVLEEYLEIKLIKKIRSQLKHIYKIQDDTEIGTQATLSSPSGHSVRVVRLENITPAQLQIIKQIEADLERKVESEFTSNLNINGDYQSTLDIENKLKNEITELIEKIGEPGLSTYSELVSKNFDQTKINNLKQYLEIKLFNKIRERLSLLPSSQIHYQSSSSVHVSHNYPFDQTAIEQPTNELPVNRDVNTHLQLGAQGSISGSGSVPQIFDEVSNNLETTEATTESESWWKRFGKKVKQGASNIKSKIIGGS